MKTILFLSLLSLSLSKYVNVNKQWRAETMERVWRVLGEHPVIDGHNDFPMAIRSLFNNDIDQINFDHDLTQEAPWNTYWANHCDLPRMKKGGMGGQFWSAFISCNAQFHDSVQLFMEQVDVIKQLVAKYPDDLMWATSSSDIETAISQGKIASMIGVESGHDIGEATHNFWTQHRWFISLNFIWVIITTLFTAPMWMENIYPLVVGR